MEKRSFYSGGIFHIYNRGSKKEALFIDNKDYRRFERKLFEYSKQSGDQVLLYCLLSNHFHLLVKVRSANSISRMMQKLQLSHARYFCLKYKTVGRIFQNRFKAVGVFSDTHLRIITRYIHRNPIGYYGGDKNTMRDYPWSSYQNYLYLEGDRNISKKLKSSILNLFNSHQDYMDFISADELIHEKTILSETINISRPVL